MHPFYYLPTNQIVRVPPVLPGLPVLVRSSSIWESTDSSIDADCNQATHWLVAVLFDYLGWPYQVSKPTVLYETNSSHHYLATTLYDNEYNAIIVCLYTCWHSLKINYMVSSWQQCANRVMCNLISRVIVSQSGVRCPVNVNRVSRFVNPSQHNGFLPLRIHHG